jgi:hypothetical protein
MGQSRSESEQRAFVEAVNERAHRALAAAGTIARQFTVAGKTVRVLFAGERLVPHIATALDHLAGSDEAQADATIVVWDSESTGVDNVGPPCSRRDFTSRGDIWGFHSDRYRIAFHWVESSVNVFDLEASQGVFWVESERTIPDWVRAAPLRSIFHWWAERNGWQLVHGAAVGTDEGAVLVTGKKGTGKSTTALASLARGLFFVADDYVIVSLDPEPTVHSLYRTAKLSSVELARLPELARCVMKRASLDGQKFVLVLDGTWAKSLARELPLRAVATPVFEDRDDSVLVPAARDLLVRAATFTTLEQLPYAGGRAHAFVERIVGRLPSYELKLGRDIERIPTALRGLLVEKPWLRCKPERKARANRPLVSVVVPTHNGAKFIPEAIESIRSQEYPKIEVILVNDGSTDDTDDVVARLPLEVRHIIHDRRSGPAEARNHGIRESRGEYVAFLDVDDLWPVRNLHHLMDHLLAHPDLDVVHGYGHLMVLDPATRCYELRGNPRESFPCYIGAGLYRRRVFERVGLFDSRLEFSEDTDWYNRAEELGCAIERLDEVTLFVRRHGQNMTTGKSQVELNVLRAFKMALDRKRARELGVKRDRAREQP